jgi:hypothetical protein
MDDRVSIMIRVSPQLKARLRAVAKREDRSVTRVCERIIRETLTGLPAPEDDVFANLQFESTP